MRAHPSPSIMLALMLIAIVLRVRYFAGCVSSDDLRHAWGGYFFWENLHRGFIQYHGIVASLRVGVDFLLWLSFLVFGAHEWSAGLVPFAFSLLGIWGIYLLGRRVAGELAGLAAAAFLSFLPLDIYLAGIWLPDTILSTLIIASVIWFMRSLEAESRRGAIGWGLLSGAALGYGFVVKSIAPMVLLAFLFWSGISARSNRRALRVGWVAAGLALLLAVQAAYWHHMTGDAFFNIRRIYGAQEMVQRMPVTLHSLLLGFPSLLVKNPVFGPALWLTPVFLAVFAAARGIRYRALILVLFAVLWFSLMKSGQMEVNPRYLLLVAPPVILVAASALAVMVRRLPAALGIGLVVATTSSTLLGLVMGFQPWTHASAEPLRAINTILALADTRDDPVFADPRVLLILYQLNGFRPYVGGLYRYPTTIPDNRRGEWHNPFAPAFDSRYGVAPDGLELGQRRRGWVVLHERYATKFDKDYWRLPLPQILWDPPANWIRTATYSEAYTGAEISLYLIQPGPPSFEALQLSQLAARRSTWAMGVVTDSVAETETRITYSADLEAVQNSSQPRWAGIRLPIKSNMFRLQMAFPRPEEIQALYVYACDGSGAQIAWHADGADLPPAGESHLYTFAPGEPDEPFIVTRQNLAAKIESVDVFVKPTPSATTVGFTILGADTDNQRD